MIQSYIALVGLVLFLGCPSIVTGQQAWIGTWQPVVPTASVAKVRVRWESPQWHIEAWGACEPRLCPWGEVPAIAFASRITASTTTATVLRAVFRSATGEADLILSQLPSGRLSALFLRRYTDGSSRRNVADTLTLILLGGEAIRRSSGNVFEDSLAHAARCAPVRPGEDWRKVCEPLDQRLQRRRP